MSDPRQEELRRRLLGLGFDTVRFAALDGPARGALREWLAAGYHADMQWMERSADKREDPRLVLTEARSLILFGINYWPGAESGGEAGPIWARYALYSDYHDTVKNALVAAGRVVEELYGAAPSDYRYYVDTGPVQEREWASRAGVGFLGKNAMLISRDFGNWLFLASMLTRLDFAADEPLRKAAPGASTGEVGLLCGKCTRCLEACPTEAIRAPGLVDAGRCLSYHSIENKGIIPRPIRLAMGNRLYGCDICLEVCPWNRFAQESRRVLLSARYDLAELSLRALLRLTPERFAEVFRGTAIKRLKLRGLLRNACIVAANTNAVDCVDLLVGLASHDDPIVRAHAVWAVFRLRPKAEVDSLLQQARRCEADGAVLAEYAAEAAASH